MPLYTVERDGSGATNDERTDAAVRALLCSMAYPGMRWVRSFFDEETERARCFYIARSSEDIEFHARAADISCLAVRTVTEVRRNTEGVIEVGGVDLTQEHDPDASLKTFVVRQKLKGKSHDEIQSAPWPETLVAGPGWLRTFIDGEIDELFSVFQHYSLAEADALAAAAGFERIEILQMGQFFPKDVEPASRQVPAL